MLPTVTTAEGAPQQRPHWPSLHDVTDSLNRRCRDFENGTNWAGKYGTRLERTLTTGTRRCHGEVWELAILATALTTDLALAIRVALSE